MGGLIADEFPPLGGGCGGEGLAQAAVEPAAVHDAGERVAVSLAPCAGLALGEPVDPAEPVGGGEEHGAAHDDPLGRERGAGGQLAAPDARADPVEAQPGHHGPARRSARRRDRRRERQDRAPGRG